MNKNYLSKSSINSINDLNELQLEHRVIFYHYARNSTCVASSWWGQFPIFYGQTFRKKRRSYWVILDNLFVPFILKNGKLSLLVLPFGDGTPDDYVNVLEHCTKFCNDFNKRKSSNVLVKWLNDDQLAFLKKSEYFDSAFSYQEHKDGPEYHYSIQDLITLDGKEYSYVRRKINKFRNTYKNIVIRDYSNDDYSGIINLNNSWNHSANLRYGALFDKEYYFEIIKNYDYLHHIILLAIDNNKIVGMISGEIANNKTGYCLFRKVLEGYDGLSEFLVGQLAVKFHSLDANIRLFNDGGAGKTAGLHFFKERFRPINKPKRYKLRRGFRILSSTAYKGPNIVSLMPSARVVVESSSRLLEEIDKDRIAMIEKVILDIFGDDLDLSAYKLESSPILIIAQGMVLIQQASRHEVKHYGYHTISANRYEIIFEIIRSSMLPKLVKCIQILYNLITFGDNAKELQSFYHRNRQKFSFTLSEYIANERKQIARRFDISCYNDLGKKGWVGEGKHSKLLSFGYSEKTTAIGCHIARDKLKSLNYIKQAGAPVPHQVNIKNGKSLQKILATISFPVVLKPRRGSKGKGVQPNISSPQELIESYKNNPFASQPMVVQEHIDGHEFRLLVINEQFIAAVRRIPAYVEGDDLHSIEELIDIKNKVERRDGLCLIPIKIDHDLTQVLKRQNLCLDSVLKLNQKVQVREVSNVSLGGITEDCTDIVHPDNKTAAVIAAKSCLLDVAGIDFISNDISQSWKEGSGKIIEINNNPGVDLHMLPTLGKKREITKYFLQSFLSTNNMGSIPKIVVTGYKGKSDVAEKCFNTLKMMGYTAGLQSDGKVKTVYNEASLAGSFISRSHQFLCNHDLAVAVMIWRLSDLISSGSPCDSITCTVITDELVDPKLLIRSHDDTIHHRVYKLLANITSHSVVIDLENENLYRMLKEIIPIKHLVLVSVNGNNSSNKKLQDHLKNKGQALSVISDKDSKRKTLLWNDGTSSQIIADKVIPSRSLLFSLAATLTVNNDVEQLKRVITLSSHQRFSFDSNSLVTLDGLAAYVCDPRDSHALKLVGNWRLSKRGCIWLIVTNNVGPSNSWQQWIETLQSKNLYVIFIANNNGSPYRKSTSLPNIEIAVEFVYKYSDPNDTMLFLEIGSSIKDRIATRLEDNEKYYIGNLFSPLNLMQLFQGKWLNKHFEIGHTNTVSLSPSTATDDDIMVIPEYVDTSQSLAMVESAFEKNCSAVVTRMIPENLPKWRPVLISENPFIGLIRLARIIRSRMEGVVFAIIGNETTCNEFCALRREDNTNAFSHTYYSGFLDEKGVVEFEDLLLKIINAQINGNNDFSFFFLPSSDILSLRILKPDVVLIDTLTHNIKPKEIFYSFDEICTVYIVVKKDQEEQWRSELEKYGFQNILLVAVDTKPPSYRINELVEKFLKNENYNEVQGMLS